MTRRSASLLALIIALPAFAVGMAWWRHHSAEEAIWHNLMCQLPTASPNPAQTNTVTTTGWLNGEVAGNFEVGQVTLRDGEIWRFAFASHHIVSSTKSYTVFQGPGGTVRSCGFGFCCEVEFHDQPQPANAHEFVALLRSRGDIVELR